MLVCGSHVLVSKTFWLVLLCIGVGLAAGLGLDGFTGRAAREAGVPQSSVSNADRASAAALDRRVATLEDAIRQESAARQALEKQVAALSGSINALDRLPAVGPATASANKRPVETGAPSVEEMGEILDRFRDRFTASLSDEAQVHRLVAGGFDAVTADQIVHRESELEMEILRLRHEARMGGTPMSHEALVGSQERLRDELGEEQYERYRDATGRPTTVRVDNVLANSPAEAADLQPGDQIIRYDDQRVYDIAELSRLTLEGEPGRSVTIDLMRDGEEIRVVIPRGPIGVQTSGERGFHSRPR